MSSSNEDPVSSVNREPQPAVMPSAELPTATDRPELARTTPATDPTEKKPENSDQDKVPLTVDKVLTYAKEAGVEFFCDQFDTPFAKVPVDQPTIHQECWQVRSRSFRRCLVNLIQKAVGIRPSPSLLRETLGVIELMADGGQHRVLSTRLAMDGETIVLDIGDDLWRQVHIAPGGWSVTTSDERCFYRFKHQQPLVEPVPGGNLEDIFKFIAVEDKQEQLLLLTWLGSALVPTIPTPILINVGGQGGAKTTRCLRLRSLVDPSLVPVLGEIEIRDFAQVFQHHAVPCFENVSSFSRRQADLFCRAVTGDGIERRRMYTDADEVIFSFRRTIMINGIDIPSHRPDFLDRSIIFQCKRLQKFKLLQSLDKEFDRERPRLIGGLLDLVVKARGLLGETDPPTSFRMADFAHFGRAVARALGKQAEDFDAAYQANFRERSHEVLEDCPVACAIAHLAKGYPKTAPWQGSATDLLKMLPTIAKEKQIQITGKSWPGSPRWLSTRLAELSPVLATEGIVITQLPRTNACRRWEIYTTTPGNNDANVTPSHDEPVHQDQGDSR